MKPHRSHRLSHGLSRRVAALTATLLLILSASCQAGAGIGTSQRASIDETFEASAVELNGIAGRVHIQLHDGHGIRLRAEGPKRWINDLVRRTEERVLVMNAGSLTGSSVNIATGPGARAETRIGSLNITPNGGVSVGGMAEAPPEVELFVPQGTPLTVTAAVGKWEIAALKAPLALEVAGAEVSAGAMTDAHLSVRGSGDITVARVEGDLNADVAGSGNIKILGGAVNALKASIVGTGSVLVQAPAERADLAVSGLGSIEVQKVRQEPKVRISGLGTVRTGYRP
jgi:hypothetical protein